MALQASGSSAGEVERRQGEPVTEWRAVMHIISPRQNLQLKC